MRIAVITAPRPRPTLALSLASLRRAGFKQPVLVLSDDKDALVMDGVATLMNEVRLGNKLNWTRALSLLVEDTETGDPDEWLMVCEDDVVWAQEAHRDLKLALAHLQVHNPPSPGAVSLYAPHRMTKQSERERGRLKSGWHWSAMQYGKKMWGAQCLLFKRSWAKRLLSDPVFRAHNANPKRDKNIDAIVGESINSAGRNVLFLIPCLVDHMGEDNSSLGYAGERPDLRTSYFKGPPA